MHFGFPLSLFTFMHNSATQQQKPLESAAAKNSLVALSAKCLRALAPSGCLPKKKHYFGLFVCSFC
jgi:hypothetical protein